jgi:hypothetical protein
MGHEDRAAASRFVASHEAATAHLRAAHSKQSDNIPTKHGILVLTRLVFHPHERAMTKLDAHSISSLQKSLKGIASPVRSAVLINLMFGRASSTDSVSSGVSAGIGEMGEAVPSSTRCNGVEGMGEAVAGIGEMGNSVSVGSGSTIGAIGSAESIGGSSGRLAEESDIKDPHVIVDNCDSWHCARAGTETGTR